MSATHTTNRTVPNAPVLDLALDFGVRGRKPAFAVGLGQQPGPKGGLGVKAYCALGKGAGLQGVLFPTETGSLRPVAIGAVVNETKPLEPSRQVRRLGDAASRQAIT
jgi:hypothetical protein